MEVAAKDLVRGCRHEYAPLLDAASEWRPTSASTSAVASDAVRRDPARPQQDQGGLPPARQRRRLPGVGRLRRPVAVQLRAAGYQTTGSRTGCRWLSVGV